MPQNLSKIPRYQEEKNERRAAIGAVRQ